MLCQLDHQATGWMLVRPGLALQTLYTARLAGCTSARQAAELSSLAGKPKEPEPNECCGVREGAKGWMPSSYSCLHMNYVLSL
jgi:hypothetical protein